MAAIPAEVHDLLVHSWEAQGTVEIGIGTQLDFVAELSLSSLETALVSLIEEEPLLTSQLVFDQRAPHWQSQAAARQTPLRVVEGEEQYWRCLHEPMTGESRFNAVLWRRESGDRLFVKLDHRLGDGAAAKELVYRLGALYTAAEAKTPLPAKPAVEGSRGLRQVFEALSWRTYMGAVWDLLRLLSRWRFLRDAYTLSGPLSPDEPLVHVSRVLTEESSRQVADYGRKHGATVNDMLLAAFYRALASRGGWDGKAPLAVPITVDLRRWLPPGAAVATLSNLSSSEITALNTDIGEAFDDTLAKVVQETRKLKDNRPGLAGALLLGLRQRDLRKQRPSNGEVKKWLSFGSPPSLTNGGIFDDTRLNFGSIQPAMTRFTGSGARYPGLIVSLSSYRSVLWLGTRTNESGVASAAAIIDTLLEELPVNITLSESC